jgi:hypothetical protein
MDVVGVIQYGSEEGMLRKIAVHSSVERNAYTRVLYQNKMNISRSVLLDEVRGKNSKSSLSDFALVVSFGPGNDIVLPALNDVIDLTKATVPSGFRLEMVK